MAEAGRREKANLTPRVPYPQRVATGPLPCCVPRAGADIEFVMSAISRSKCFPECGRGTAPVPRVLSFSPHPSLATRLETSSAKRSMRVLTYWRTSKLSFSMSGVRSMPKQGSAEVAAVWLPLRFFPGKWRFPEADARPIMGGMLRLRRVVVSDCWSFVTCRFLPRRGIHSPASQRGVCAFPARRLVC